MPGAVNEARFYGGRWTDRWRDRYFRLAASGVVPAGWYQPDLPPPAARAQRSGRLHVEIVSHCWNYAHLLVYQLSSLVTFPPADTEVTMTVFWSPEDERTGALLDYFQGLEVSRVHWNWQPLPREQLFRRAIGRNRAALASRADWVWFTDCDLLFRDECLDALARAVQGRSDTLVFPRQERCTSLLAPDDPILLAGMGHPQLLDIPEQRFTVRERDRATGPLQIVHGDVARTCGYCDRLAIYQKPSPVWLKTHEDRAFRWLLRTQGTPLDIPSVYRIRHVHKGRYTGGAVNTGLRSRIRRLTSWLAERRGG